MIKNIKGEKCLNLKLFLYFLFVFFYYSMKTLISNIKSIVFWIYFSLFYLFFWLFFRGCFGVIPLAFCKIRTDESTKEKIFLAVITHSSTRERAKGFLKYFNEYLKDPRINGPTFYYTSDPEPQEFLDLKNSIKNKMKHELHNGLNYDIVIKTLMAFKDFLNTDCEWFLRPTDDATINPNGWPDRFLWLLGQYKDPYNNPYFMGQCQTYGNNVKKSFYVQG